MKYNNMENNTLIKRLMEIWSNLSKEKKLVAAGAAALAFVLVVGAGLWISSLGKTADTVGTEDTQGTEIFGTEVVWETEIEEETETTQVEELVQTISVSMTATSIEKDLKIKIVDEKDALVTGQHFVIIVTPEGKEDGTEYADDNGNGIIHIKSIKAGKYTVQLKEMEGFVVTQNPISATVKDKIVYEKVEIKNEIKNESEIDASKEDTANKDVEVEDEIQNTLPLLESTISTTEVKKEQVDFSNFPAANVSEEKEAGLPKKVTLYSYGNDSSKSVHLQLNVTDEMGVINDIVWKVDSSVAETDSTVLDWEVAEDKKSVTLTAKTEGTATVSVVLSYVAAVEEAQDEARTGTEADTQLQTQELTCEITVGAHTDDKTQLKDLAGNALFLDKEAKTIATPKTYATAEKFFANPQYTGWQTIDGKLYYYKADHTVATGRQVIGGVTYDFNADGSVIEKSETMGIDVSKWQGEIDWKSVAGAGVDFAIIRCGYRGSSSGTLVEDPYFKKNIEGATKNGIKVGVYFFTQAITAAEAVEEASMAIELVKGYRLQLPIFVDTEKSGGRGDKLSRSARTNIVKAFCETVKNAGYKPGVYSGRSWYNDNLNADELSSYHIWVAQYGTECAYTGHYDIWQYTDKGTIPGISGKVDMNIAYTSYY